MKVAEAQAMELELTRLRSENSEIRGRLSEVATLEAAKKKAEARTEFLEEKVSLNWTGWPSLRKNLIMTRTLVRWKLLSRNVFDPRRTNLTLLTMNG